MDMWTDPSTHAHGGTIGLNDQAYGCGNGLNGCALQAAMFVDGTDRCSHFMDVN